jgi:hypothetical protein
MVLLFGSTFSNQMLSILPTDCIYSMTDPSPPPNPLDISEFRALDLSKWSLHWDQQLLAYITQRSASLTLHTKKLQDSLDDLEHDANCSEIRLKNAFNQFLMLSNTQFIENRVYEEDDPLEDVTPTETESTEAAASPASTPVMELYGRALSLGMEAMKMFTLMEDGEDFAIDVYNERPLPFVIGSKDFLEDETLGLGDAPVYDSSSSDEEEEESVSGSDTDEGGSSQGESSQGDSGDSQESSGEEEGGGEDLFGFHPTPSTRSSKVERDVSVASYESGEESEDELFAHRPSSAKTEVLKKQASYTTSLFDREDSEEEESEEEEPSLFGEEVVARPSLVPARVPGGVSVFPPLPVRQKEDSEGSELFEDEPRGELSASLFGEVGGSLEESPDSSPSLSSSSSSSTDNLFGRPTERVLSPKASERISSLFGDAQDSSSDWEEEEEDSSLFGKGK